MPGCMKKSITETTPPKQTLGKNSVMQPLKNKNKTNKDREEFAKTPKLKGETARVGVEGVCCSRSLAAWWEHRACRL